MKLLFLTLLAVLYSVASPAQDKVLTMEEAVLGYHLRPQNLTSLQWRAETHQVSWIENNNLLAFDADNQTQETLLSLEELNQIMGTSLKRWPTMGWKDAETIKVMLYIEGVRHEINVKTKKIVSTLHRPQGAQNLTSNGGDLFAFTRANNLFYMDGNGNEFQVTFDSDPNFVNGQTVSRNEFGIMGGIFWSPDGKELAFYRKDESQVKTFPLLDINSRTGELFEIKYPMAGMKSEQVSLGVYDVASGKTVWMKVDDFGREQYLTNIAWDSSSKKIYIQVLNREQKHMRLNQYDASTGEWEKTLLEEKNDKYVEPLLPVIPSKRETDKLIYRTNNRDGYFNLYLVSTDKGTVERMTKVEADVQFVAQNSRYLYYTSAEVSPVENHLFRLDLKTGRKMRLTQGEGWHRVLMSKDCRYFLDNYSNVRLPRVINLTDNNGRTLKELLRAEDPSKDYNYGEITLGSVRSADGLYDNYYRLIKPSNFDPQKKYPTIVYVYGGPHSQLVLNTWQAELRRWEMYMAQHGYVVFVMDNRGTQNRGLAFEQAIHGQCGQCEMADQMEGVKFLQSLPYVDQKRIGVHGWSYGGFMTISLLTNYPDIFKVAVAGGPVIDWRWYEVMYGERYMDSPHRNQEGYDKVSLMNKAKDLKGKLLICQGAVDNTVVWQHSLSFIRQCIVNQVQVDYFPYPCAQHNVMGKDRIHLMQKVTDYFEDYLK